MRELLADARRRRLGWTDVKILLQAGKGKLMAIIVDSDTRLVVQGLTAARAVPRAAQPRYGTHVVAGVTPGKGGQDVEGIPVFNTVADAVEEDGREHDDDLRPGALRGRRDLRGGRRRDLRP